MNVLARELLLKHLYVNEYKNNCRLLYRFMLVNKSTLSTTHRFLSKMMLSIAYQEFIIQPSGYEIIRTRNIHTLISMLRIVKPSNFTLVFAKSQYEKKELEWIISTFDELRPFLGGVTKLKFHTRDQLDFIVKSLAPQLKELDCFEELLIDSTMPILDLDLLKICPSKGLQRSNPWKTLPVVFNHILRHRVRKLDLSSFGFELHSGSLLDFVEVDQHPMECLVLGINNLRAYDKLSEFILKLHAMIPKFKKLELVTKQIHFMFDESELSTKILESVAKIENFKRQVDGVLTKLVVKIDGFEFALKKKIERNWVKKLEESGQFQDVEFEEDPMHRFTETVKLHKFDGILLLLFKMELNINDVDEWNPIYDDDLY